MQDFADFHTISKLFHFTTIFHENNVNHEFCGFMHGIKIYISGPLL